MAVPDTSTFSLQDVVDEITPSSNTLQTCYDESIDVNFDASYMGDKNRLSNFRNYGERWYLPTFSDLNTMYTNLKNYGVGDFSSDASVYYWSSTETGTTTAYSVRFSSYAFKNASKSDSEKMYVRACWDFISNASYNLRDTGPRGGLIFYITYEGDGYSKYYEAASTDASTNCYWSNVIDSTCGANSSGIGDGLSNTRKILTQSGHTSSAAEEATYYNFT
jgi:hypothetical protein